MSYLKFDKSTLINLEQSLPKEMLRTNHSGAYHCTTLIGCHTRKYHGLLVIPVPEIDEDNHVLLSSIDETIIQHGAEFNLGIHKYQGDNYSPKGHKYIREFDYEVVPRVTFRVGGVILSKEKLFVWGEDRIIVKYTLIDAHSPTTLRLRPFLSFRNVNDLTLENEYINKAYQEVEHGIKTCLYPGYPELFMQTNKKNNFVFIPDWYKGIEYSKEIERGFPFKEDLYTPGYFELPIKKGESVYLSAGTSQVNAKRLKTIYETEVSKRDHRDSLYNCLKNSAQQFYNYKDDSKHYLLAGYPWFKVRARDTFIALPGCTLSIDKKDNFEKIMHTGLEALIKFIKKEKPDPIIKEIEQPDVPLWAIWAIQQYCKEYGTEELCSNFGTITEIIEFIRTGRHPNLFLHDNGLLYSYGKEKAISWMNSSIGNLPVVPRSGSLVEFNALWSNALRFAAKLYRKKGQENEAIELEILAEKVGDSFKRVFKNEAGYLFDYVDGDYKDWSVRPNMLFAISLEFSPLNRQERKQVLDYITKELLTPKGIRSLSPKSQGYTPYYAGPQAHRDYAYHQGTAWPWLMGFYLEAYLNIFGMSGLTFAENRLISFEDEMANNCVGTISELYDGNPPFTGRGAVSFAMNVAEILRAMKLIKSFNI
ncbi:MAG: amylo-alpha-1,6-glucosidase [Bacteroidota bacterium]|nr:amylo-alpha-1,6-glucosidase [Bacteroidota bacterium]